MKAILLFDSKCSKCSQMAAEIAYAAGGKIELGSLYDPEMSAILRSNNLSWEWKPTLLIFQNNRVKVFTSKGLGWKLIQLLGVRRAFRLLRTVQRYSALSTYGLIRAGGPF